LSMLGTGVMLAIILVLVKLSYVDSVQRQFTKAVNKGYPNKL